MVSDEDELAADACALSTAVLPLFFGAGALAVPVEAVPGAGVAVEAVPGAGVEEPELVAVLSGLGCELSEGAAAGCADESDGAGAAACWSVGAGVARFWPACVENRATPAPTDQQ